MSHAAHVTALHAALLTAWNNRDAKAMAALFEENGLQIGFDGSEARGTREIESHLTPIFRDHPTARYVWKVREVRTLGDDIAVLRAVAGMIPPGTSTIKPEVNAIQSLLASRSGGGPWKIELFQNTPVQWHGRPQDVKELTEELQALA